MESRVVLFLVLSLTIIFSYPYFLDKMAPPSASPIQAIKGKETPGVKTAVRPEAPTGNALQSASLPEKDASASPLPTETISATDEQLKVIEGDLYRAVLSSRGGVLKEWRLKRYSKKDANGVSQPIQLIPPSGKIAPLTLTGETGLDQLSYSLDTKPLELNANKPSEKVLMTATLPDGRSITKEVVFYNDQYQADLRIATTGLKDGYQLSLGSNFGITDWQNAMGGNVGAITMIDGKIVSDRLENTMVTHTSGVTWFGIQDKYYMSAFLQSGKNTVMGSISVQGFSKEEVSAAIHVPSGSQEIKLTLYAGPKEYDRLASYHNYMEESIDFGWFIYGSWLPVRLVAKPLFYILRFIYNMTQNYGAAIILLTIFVKAIFHPITQKSLVSMKQMAGLQPKVEAVKKKWSDNRERMNKELMELYKQSGVNPLGGCMPMLLQMPVFIALFNVLYVSIELKEAPFILWITDLSDKDPYYVLPIIMGGTMIIQQLTQPNTMDPVQAKIMLFMPILYTFFFLSFPSGLVLYWLVNNVLSIAQQCWINRKTAVAT
jgi:YidC/Oxa1 family membrane protein insertase